jgi:hypothetical protein
MSGTWGFKDVVTNPQYWDDLKEGRRERRRQAEQWTDEELTAAVRFAVFDDTGNRDRWVPVWNALLELSSRVNSVILGLLGDCSLRKKLVKRFKHEDVGAHTPFERACDLIADPTPVEAAPLLSPFLDHSFEEVRKEVALHLGAIANSDVLPSLHKVLADPSYIVVNYSLIGLNRAIEYGRMNNALRRELCYDLTRLLAAGKLVGKRARPLLDFADIARLLLRFDRDRATDLFLSEYLSADDGALSPDSRAFKGVLEASADAKVKVPRSQLRAITRRLETGELKYPRQYSLAAALRLLGQHKVPQDRAFLKARMRITRNMSHERKTVAEGAAAALLAAYDIEDFRERLCNAVRDGGCESLTDPQRYYWEASIFDAEVNNGGISQYFVNSSGDHWPDALAGLEAMGAKRRAAMLRDAVKSFGKVGPSQNTRKRRKQLAELEREDAVEFSDSDYYGCAEIFGVFTARYVIRNAEAFR